MHVECANKGSQHSNTSSPFAVLFTQKFSVCYDAAATLADTIHTTVGLEVPAPLFSKRVRLHSRSCETMDLPLSPHILSKSSFNKFSGNSPKIFDVFIFIRRSLAEGTCFCFLTGIYQ